MRTFLRHAACSAILITSLQASAQNDRFAYAITDLTKEGMGWNALRRLDLQTGQYSDILLNGMDAKTLAFDAASKKQIFQKQDASPLVATPFGNGVAAMAYDKRHNRLYFTPMFSDELRFVDLSSMKLFYVTGQPFTGRSNPDYDQGKIVTRMAIAPDGNGYAVTSDGNMLVKFSMGKKTTITHLGPLVDAPSNNGISIHSKCSSYGGDMIADDRGNLIIITARNHMFKVNIETKEAEHLGSIEGLPADFTVNGAVVDAKGNLLVSSAISNSGYYVVDMQTLKATVFQGMTDVFRSSDLANSNCIITRDKDQAEITTIQSPQSNLSNAIQIYPNPVVDNKFTVQFNNMAKGDYTIQLTNLLGQQVMHRKFTIASEYQTQQIPISRTQAKGVYLVKLLNLDKKTVFEQKVLVH